MARAAAFIAVGLLLMGGGVVYQRLWESEPREGAAGPAAA
jgi:hypothetical protein